MRRKFRVGDRVEVIDGALFNIHPYLQEDNHVGTVAGITLFGYWVRIDKPVKLDRWKRWWGIKIPKGYAYKAFFWELKGVKEVSAVRPHIQAPRGRRKVKGRKSRKLVKVRTEDKEKEKSPKTRSPRLHLLRSRTKVSRIN